MYALAVIFKPQAIMFAPVVGLAYVYALFKKGGLGKAILGIFGGLAAAVAVFAVFIWPFSPVMPDTGYMLENADDRIIVELEGSHEIDSVKYYAEGEGSFSLTYSDDGESYYDVMFQPVDEDGTPEGKSRS